MAGLDPLQLQLEPDPTFLVAGCEVATFFPAIRASIASLRQKWEGVREGLAARELLTPRSRELARSTIVVDLEDEREDKTTPLPPLVEDPPIVREPQSRR